jgi:hypothetical protein
MLVSPSETWRGTDGRVMSVADFERYVAGLKLTDWTPEFVVLHNTAAPTSTQWKSTSIQTRLKNLTSYYSGLGWHGGPHLFVDDQGVCLFTPLTVRGVHSPSWNGVAWGIEMVGDYDTESFDTGFGLAVRKNAEHVLAALLRKIGKPVTPDTLRLHYEDRKTTHACPGKHVKKAEVLAEVTALMVPAPKPPIVVAKSPGAAVPPPAPPKRYAVLMTEFGGRGDPQESCYGGTVNPRAFEVALPCKVSADKRTIAIYRGTRRVICRVNDLGPWNRTDAYWLGSGHPKAEQQKVDRNYAENGLVPTNSAGLDATPAVFNELGITGAESTRSANVEWEFVPPALDKSEPEPGDHPVPPPKPPPAPQPTRTWWQALLNALLGRT